MLSKNWKREVFTIPNMLSLFRLLLIPVYITIYLNARDNSDYILAACILAVSCLTDLVDGKIARHFNMITSLGTLLDPLADKLTQFALIICLTYNYPVLWFLVGLFVIKESFQLIAGGVFLKKGRMLKGAQLTGKICTTVLFISLIALVMIPNLSNVTVRVIVLVDSVFMVVAFIDYLLVYLKKASKFRTIEKPEKNKTRS